MKSPSIWIIDIINATNAIDRLLQNYSFKQFKADERTNLAISKLIENIGEACTHLEREFKANYSEIPWNKIVAMRNRLAHQYWDIDFEIMWIVATKEAPVLKKELLPALEKIQAQEKDSSNQ